MATKRGGEKPTGADVGADSKPVPRKIVRERKRRYRRSGDVHNGSGRRKASSRRYAPGFVAGKYQDAGIRGHVFIAGKTGSGKTTELLVLIRGAKRAVIFDPKTQFKSERGWKIFSQPGQLREFMAAHINRPMVALYQPTSGDIIEHFEHVATLVGRAGSMIFAIDEVDMVCQPNSFKAMNSPFWAKKENQTRSPALRDLVHYGRHRRVALICTTRRPANVTRDLTGNCSEMRVFRTTEPRDISYFSDQMGADAQKLPMLEDFEMLLWQDDADPIVFRRELVELSR